MRGWTQSFAGKVDDGEHVHHQQEGTQTRQSHHGHSRHALTIDA